MEAGGLAEFRTRIEIYVLEFVRDRVDPEVLDAAFGFIAEMVESFSDDLFFVLVATTLGLVRAMGVTIESGQTGLLFSFGRATRVLDPGFHLLIPFLQRVRRLPTRSRTLDLPAQRVTTLDGLVYHVDANLVYRIVDVRKALIEIDDVVKGMLQMLGLGVQEVLRGASYEELQASAELDEALKRNLLRRLAPWGVDVEHAGLPSVTPSQKTLRITQLEQIAGERGRMLDLLSAEIGPQKGLALIGARLLPRPRAHVIRHVEAGRRRSKRLRTLLMQRGHMGVQVDRALRRLRARELTVAKKDKAKNSSDSERAET